MRERISKFLKKLSLIGVTVAGAVTMVASGSLGFPTIQPLQPATAAAASSCPYESEVVERTNIIYCGLTGTNSLQLMQSFQNYYSANSDAHSGNPDTHTDLKRVYNEVAVLSVGGFNSNMFSSGKWQVGTSNSKGEILDSAGNLVGTNVQITSRCAVIDNTSDANCKPDEISKGLYKPLSDASGHITNVYYRDATWFFDKDTNTMPTLLHFNTNGVLDFATWEECGNTLIFKPVLPKQTLVCKQLDYKLESQDDNTFVYSFTVTATVENVTNITYAINYGDGKTESKSVTNGQATMNFGPHTYTRLEKDTTYTIKAIVNNQPQVATCQKDIIVTGKNKLTFACLDLKADLDSSSTKTNQIYNFVGKVQGTDNAVSYKFTFTNADGSQSTVNVNPDSSNAQQSVSIQHQYAIDTTKDQTFFAAFSATSKTGLTTEASGACAFSASTTHGPLPKTGPEGTFGIFAGVSTIGAALHQIVLRRKAKAL